MRYRSRWIELTYEAKFKTASFRFATGPAVLLREWYEAISPRYSLSTQDLSADPGRTVADVRANASLFGGNVTFEVNAERFKGVFRNVFSEADVQIVKDCLALALTATTRALEVEYAEQQIRLKTFVTLLDDPTASQTFLQNLFTKTSPLASIDVPGVDTVIPAGGVELISPREAWSFAYDISKSALHPDDIFISTHARYDIGSPYRDLGSQQDHFVKCLSSAFAACGLETSTFADQS